MMTRLRILLAALALLWASPGYADFTFTSGSGNTAFDFTCFTSKHCYASVPINSAGTEIFTSGAPGQVTGANGTFPLTAASGSIASGAMAAGSMVDLLTMRGTKAPGTAAANALLAGAIYTAAGVTLSDGQQASLQFTSTGGVRTFIENSTAAIANNADAVAASASLLNSPVVSYGYVWNGSTYDRMPGTTAGVTVRSPTAANFLVTLPAETTKVLGTVRNVGNVGGVFDAVIGAAPPANGLQTVALTSGATGGLIQPLIQCDSKAIYDASTNGSTELQALTSGRTIYVCGYSILSAGTVNVKLIYGTGTACATGSNNMTPAYQLTAQVGIVDGSPFSRGLKTASANALCINTSAGIAVQAIVYYAII